MEAVLNDGLDLQGDMRVEFDIEGLSRMNTEARFRTAGESLKVATHNEARARLNLAPIEGGDAVYLQQQNFALSDLVKLRQMEFEAMERDSNDTPDTPDSSDDDMQQQAEEQTRALIDGLRKGLLNA